MSKEQRLAKKQRKFLRLAGEQSERAAPRVRKLTRHWTEEESEEFNGPFSRTVKNKFALPVKMQGDPQAESGPCSVAEEDIDESELQRCKIFAGQRMSMGGYRMQRHFAKDEVTELHDGDTGEVVGRVYGNGVYQQLKRAGNKATPHDFTNCCYQSAKIFKVDMGERKGLFGRHHDGSGEVYNPGGRHRIEEPASSGKEKTDVSMVKDGVTEEQLMHYMNRMQPFMNAAVAAVYPDYQTEMDRNVDKINELWGRSKAACFAFLTVSIGLQYGAGMHRDKSDTGVAVWGISGTVDLCLPEFETVVRLQDGDVFVFDARKYWHGCVKRNHRLGRYAIASEWNRDTHWTAMAKEKDREEKRRTLESRAEERAAARPEEEQEEDRREQEQLAEDLREADMSEAQISYFQKVQRLFGHLC